MSPANRAGIGTRRSGSFPDPVVVASSGPLPSATLHEIRIVPARAPGPFNNMCSGRAGQGQIAMVEAKPVNERYGLWVLKKSLFLKIAEILGVENVYQNGDRRL